MTNDKIIDRIKKLLSLSRSTNQHEAALAAAQAADLMLAHEIEEASLCEAESAPEDVESGTLDECGKRRVPWKGTLANALTKSQGCRSYTDKAGGLATIKIVGQPSKVATIRYMYAYLVSEVNRLADCEYRDEHEECKASGVPAPSARSWKNAFRLGAASTIGRRLLDQRKETHAEARISGQGSALVVVAKAQEAVETYVRRNVPGLRTGRRASYSSRSGYGAGVAAGKGVVLGGGRGLGSGAKQLGS